MALLFCVGSFAYSINPKKIHYPLFSVYANGKTVGTQISLPTIYLDVDEVKAGGRSAMLPMQVFENVTGMAQSVLEVRSSAGEGSAVHVGGKLVLTNLHVISSSQNENIKSCRANFYSKAYFRKTTKFKCKKIHYCSKELDFCLLELFDSKRGTELDQSKSAKLRSFYNPQNADEVELFAVGNTGGHGIYASSGYGLDGFGPNNIKYFAGSFKGNSGGGLFTSDGDLVAIVNAQSPNLYGKDAFNVAIPLRLIKKELETNSKLDVKVLKQINW